MGTNTALLLVAEVGEEGALRVVHEAERFVRLGEGVDASGRIGAAAMGRLAEALRAYRRVAESYGAEVVCVAGTSASRDAENQDELIAFVRREAGLAYEILSGDDEALWTYRGARSAFPDLAGRAAVVDVGGGSTEIVIGEACSLSFRRSLDVGSVRLAERYFSMQPPPASAVEKAEALVGQVLDSADLPLDSSIPLIGAAGTAVTLALVHCRASSWKDLDQDFVALPAAEVRAWRQRLLRLSYEDVLALDPTLMQGRADVFPAGVLILDTVMRRLGVAGCRISPRSLRHGLALRWLEGQK